MHWKGERLLIYSALLILCGAVGTLLGSAAAICSLLQIAVVIETIFWLGTAGRDKPAREWQGHF